MRASHQQHKFPFNGSDIDILPGQFISGREKAALELGCTPSKYRRAMNYLISTERITTKSTNKFSIITVLNWNQYQDVTSNQTSQQPASDQPATTYKNVKNDKNEKNILPASPSASGEVEIIKDEDRMTAAEFRAYQAKGEGYKGHLTIPLVKWAEEKLGRKFPNQLKQRKAVSSMLRAGWSVEEIKQSWADLEDDDFWAEKGIDFGVVLNQIGKVKNKKKSIAIIKSKYEHL